MPPRDSLTPQCWNAWHKFRPLLMQCGWPALPIAKIHPDGSVSVDQPSLISPGISMLVGCLEDGSIRAAVMHGFSTVRRLIVNPDNPNSLAQLKNAIGHVFRGEPLTAETKRELVRIH
jgi:hypothetical protein